MKLLLDTHAFIWLNNEPSRLSETVIQLCQSGTHEFYLSLASPWEMQIKQQLGKLTLGVSLDELIQRNIESNRIQLLPIEIKHISYLSRLPFHHNDPFDRMIIAQALVEQMTIISVDSAFSAYSVAVIW